MTYPFVPAKWFSRGAIVEVQALVVHFAEGGSTVHYFETTTRDVSAHFVLQYDGTIVQMVRDEDADHCQHISYGSWLYPGDLTRKNGVAVLGDVMSSQDPTRVNRYVHAIELEGFRAQGPNPAQSAALAAWVAERRATFPTIRGLLGHGDIQDKGCPGALIPWALLGGHGLWEEDMPAFPFRVPGGARAGTVTIPAGIDTFRVKDGTKAKAKAATTSGTSAIHDVPGGSPGFLVTTVDGTFWVRSADVQFAPMDCADQVAAEHERTRSAAIAAVEAI